MVHLEISLPVFKKDKWERLERHGKIQVSSEVDTLSEGYKSLKAEVDVLLAELHAQNRLAEDAGELERQIQDKAHKLKQITKDIEIATEHYKSLKLFLENFGVDVRHKKLTFDKQLLLSEVSVSEVEVIAENSYPGDEF